MPPGTDALAARLDQIRHRLGMGNYTDSSALLGAVEAVLWVHKIEPLYAHADSGECGCPVPGEDADVADDVAYDDAHPEGCGPDGTGLVCKSKVVGHWCRGCADVAVEHGCFGTPKDYPPEKCPERAAITAELLGKETGHA
jgi:hypothetical protein